MRVSICFFALVVFVGSTVSVMAQDQALEEQAYPLLDQVIAEARTLKLPENRSRLQIIAAGLLWKRDQVRARSLFSEAAANLVELENQTRDGLDQTLSRRPSLDHLRQELLLIEARHDPAQPVPQKNTELEKSGAGFGQLTYLTQLGASSNLLATAAAAPLDMRTRLYQQAALKALDEGSEEGARQIANAHLDTQMQQAVFQRITAQRESRKDEPAQLQELMQALELTVNEDRVSLLLQLAEFTKENNPKDSHRFLEEAYGLVTSPATSYKQLEDQQQVALLFTPIEPQRRRQLLESGIKQLNELMAAAAVLNGFEVQIFINGEMPLPGNSQLGAEVLCYGRDLGILAKSDFRSAVSAAEQFRYPEARLFAQLSIIEAVLGRDR